jgi:hypothetical protein
LISRVAIAASKIASPLATARTAEGQCEPV